MSGTQGIRKGKQAVVNHFTFKTERPQPYLWVDFHTDIRTDYVTQVGVVVLPSSYLDLGKMTVWQDETETLPAYILLRMNSTGIVWGGQLENCLLVLERQQALCFSDRPQLGPTDLLIPALGVACCCGALETHFAFLALCMVWGRQERGTRDYLWENLAFITSPKVAQTAPLMKSCFWFKRAIVSLTFVLTQNIPPILLSYCSHFGFL